MNRQDFPLLEKQKELIYLDSAATTQKPAVVIDTLSQFYKEHYGTVHRGVYDLSMQASSAYNGVREKVKRFLNATSSQEIVFTRGTTAGINLIARSFAKGVLKKGDKLLVTIAEHHSNLVPWQMAAEDSGADLQFIPITKEGKIDIEVFKAFLNEKVKLVALPHISNVLGIINPIKQIAELTHQVGAYLVVDGAQAAPHLPVDVQELGADFYLFSGHKLYGPTGVGVLYGKKALLEALPPVEGGGDMIDQVSLSKTTYAEPPLKFEAGTPMIAEVIGLGAAIDYVQNLGMDKIHAWENTLLQHTLNCLATFPEITLLGTASPKSGIISFVAKQMHPLDLATLLNCKKVAIRSGHLCSQPAMHHFGITACARISFGIYNTLQEIDCFISYLSEILKK